MWLMDEWAERHILQAQQQGELDNLPGMGKPLTLDDDSAVPEALRTGYRMLKNAGFLPPELLGRNEALQLADLLDTLDPLDPEYQAVNARLRLLELKLKQVGIATDFLQRDYRRQLEQRFNHQ